MKYYVYMQNVNTGKTQLVGGNYKGVYDTMKEAVNCITSLYVWDSKSLFKGDYYYFIKERR